MSTYTFEEPIGFHLIKVKGAVKTGADAYRAVLAHNGLSTRATLEELAKDTNLPEHQLRYFGTTILGALIANTLKDGRSRNFEGLVTTRLDITGKFNRIDEPFDPTKHACVLSFAPGPNAADYRRKANPINETKPPRGRFDYVTYPGGEKGFIKIGEEIQIHGHDLKLDHTVNYIYFTTLNAKGEERFFIRAVEGRAATEPQDMEVLENTDSFLRLAWPAAITPETIGEQTTAKFKFVDGQAKDRHDSFSRPVTILR